MLLHRSNWMSILSARLVRVSRKNKAQKRAREMSRQSDEMTSHTSQLELGCQAQYKTCETKIAPEAILIEQQNFDYENIKFDLYFSPTAQCVLLQDRTRKSLFPVCHCFCRCIVGCLLRWGFFFASTRAQWKRAAREHRDQLQNVACAWLHIITESSKRWIFTLAWHCFHACLCATWDAFLCSIH